MIPVISDPFELRRRGFEALVSSLGWTNAVRFLQQYELGQHDYTRERDDLLPDWDAATLVRKARALKTSLAESGSKTSKSSPLARSKPKRKRSPKPK
jgi:hypothetical protein